MTYFPKIMTTPADGEGIDAFGRQRVSNPVTLFDSKQLNGNQPLLWVNQTSSANISFQFGRSSMYLNVTSSAGSTAIRQTRTRFDYQPGKSLLINSTFVMGLAVAGIQKQVGYFDENNGVFLEQSTSGSIAWAIRSNVTGTPVNTYVSQSLWNLDKLDGNGPSGIRLDLTKAQIMSIDLQWLGVGRVRTGFVISGNLVYTHEFNHANSTSVVYMSTPNLPVRSMIQCMSTSLNATATLESICTSVISEGGYNHKGLIFSADRAATTLTGVDSAALYPLVSIRLRSGALGSNVTPLVIDALTTTNNATFRWALVLNPGINGVDAASWVQITNSSVEYDISRTTTNSLTGGTVLRSGYATTTSHAEEILVDSAFTLGAEVDGTRDQFVLAVQTVGAGTNAFVGSFTWNESVV
jgi:hypothetical protein